MTNNDEERTYCATDAYSISVACQKITAFTQ